MADGGRKNKADVSLVLPCRDEEATVAECVLAAAGFLASSGLRGEILVVDNGSRDSSAALAAAAGARVIREDRPGYGNALRRGIAESCGRVILMADADMTYDFSRFGDLYGPLAHGRYDMIIGDRFRGGIEPGAMPLSHRMGVRFLSALGRLRFRTQVRDFHCGMRGLTAAAAGRLELRCEGMEFATEMIAAAAAAGMRIGEVPVPLRRSTSARSSKLRTVRDGLRHLRLIIKSKK